MRGERHDEDQFDDLTNDELLGLLGEILRRVDPVPHHVVGAARASGSWRNVDSELAALIYDSASPAEELAGVRGPGGRLLSFSAPSLSVDIEVLPGGEGIVGHVTEPRPAVVEVLHGGGSLILEADERGRFIARDIHPGPVTVLITNRVTGVVTRTGWMLV